MEVGGERPEDLNPFSQIERQALGRLEQLPDLVPVVAPTPERPQEERRVGRGLPGEGKRRGSRGATAG